MPRTEKQFQSIREKTKARILSTALELFAHKGFKGTTISDIAKAAGISKGLAYNYFSSKQDLMKSVLNLLVVEIEQLFGATQNISDPYEKLKVIIESTFDSLEKDETFWRLYVSFILQPEVKEEADLITSSLLDDGFNLFEKIFKEIGVKKPKKEAKLLGAIVDGISFHYIFNKDSYPLKQMKKFILSKYSKENF